MTDEKCQCTAASLTQNRPGLVWAQSTFFESIFCDFFPPLQPLAQHKEKQQLKQLDLTHPSLLRHYTV